MPLQKEDRQDFAATDKLANFTLVVSHDKRKKINRQQNLQDKPSDAVFVRAPKITCQGMHLKICGFGLG